MFRHLIMMVAVLVLVPSVAAASHIGIPATWDFESPVDGFSWSSTTRTEYFYTVGGAPPILTSQYLGPHTTTPLTLLLMDLFSYAQPYSFSFDLIFFGSGPPSGFSVVSHGQTIVSAGDLSGAELIGQLGLGGSVIRFSSLISPGATPMGGPGSCCGDVIIEWSMAGGDQWGIDNFVIDVVPEPNSALLLGLGLMELARRRRITSNSRTN